MPGDVLINNDLTVHNSDHRNCYCDINDKSVSNLCTCFAIDKYIKCSCIVTDKCESIVMTDCEIDNNDSKLMQMSNDLNSYCVNESINSDNTNLVDLNNKCLNGGFNSDHIDIGDLNNKCLNESIFNKDKTDFDYLNYKCLNESIYSDNNDLDESNNKCLNESILNREKTDFEFSNLKNKCLSKSVNSDKTDFSDLNNNCFNESIYSDNTDFGECSNDSVNSDNTDSDLNKCLENDSKADMFNVFVLSCCGLKNKLQYPEFQELLSVNDIICLIESKTGDTDDFFCCQVIFLK